MLGQPNNFINEEEALTSFFIKKRILIGQLVIVTIILLICIKLHHFIASKSLNGLYF